MSLTWPDLAAIASVSAGALCLLFWAFRGRLANDFVAKAAHDEAMERLDEAMQRLGAIESRLQNVPSHEDFRQIERRIGDVAKDVAVVTAHTQGLKDSSVRIERHLDRFVRAQLDWEKGQ